MDIKITDRLGEVSSWVGLAAALWGATALAPEWLAGGLGLDVAGWRVVCVIAAMAATICISPARLRSIATPYAGLRCRRQKR